MKALKISLVLALSASLALVAGCAKKPNAVENEQSADAALRNGAAGSSAADDEAAREAALQQKKNRL